MISGCRTAIVVTAISFDVFMASLQIGPTARAGQTPESQPAAKVSLLRVPNDGVQPQVMVDNQGIVHLVYLAGEPRACDIYYVRSADGFKFSQPMRVNSEPGSAISIGNIRGAHMALGKSGRIHVAWMGSDKAKPRGPKDSVPMLYSRLNDSGSAFEPQRNVIQKAAGLDGGGSVAADPAGNVYVLWHAPEGDNHAESHRCIWMTRSTNEGATFGTEIRANPDATGVCGCCGMRAAAGANGKLFALYRSAAKQIHRDMYLLVSADRGDSFRSTKVDPWTVRVCPMSSMAFGIGNGDPLATWETEGQVHFSRFDPASGKLANRLAAPGFDRGRRHPVVASNTDGETILAWTEGMGWNKAGSLAWQVFDKSNKPTAEKGRASPVPAGSVVAVFARPDGRFVVVH